MNNSTVHETSKSFRNEGAVSVPSDGGDVHRTRKLTPSKKLKECVNIANALNEMGVNPKECIINHEYLIEAYELLIEEGVSVKECAEILNKSVMTITHMIAYRKPCLYSLLRRFYIMNQ